MQKEFQLANDISEDKSYYESLNTIILFRKNMDIRAETIVIDF